MDLKSPSELLASKVKAFKNCLQLASDCLSHKDYGNAEMLYGSILADFHNDFFIEALNLNDLDLFSLHTCFAYSSIGSDFKTEQALVILNSIHKPIKLPLVPYLKAFVHISNDRISFATDELKVCQTLLNDGYNFKPNHILNEDIVPEINDGFLKLKLNGLKFACELLKAKEDNEELKKCFKENWLKIGKLCENDFAKFAKKETPEESSSSEKTEKKNPNPAQTGAVKKAEKLVQKSNTGTIGIQTIPPNGVCVAVQTMEKDSNKQLLAAVLDIKNKMNNLQNKKDNEIKQLQKKNNELTEKLRAKETKREQISPEFEFLKKQYFKLEEKIERSQKQVECLQKLLVEQFQQKYLLQKSIYELFEEKCDFKVEFLNDTQKILKSGSKITPEECKQEIMMWKNTLNKVSGAKKSFDEYYKSIDNLIVAKKYSSIKLNDWPGIPSVPTDVQDLVHRNFKRAIQQDNKRFYTIAPPAQPSPPPNNCATLFGSYSESFYSPNYFANTYNTYNEDGRTTGSPPSSSRSSRPVSINGGLSPQPLSKKIGFASSPPSSDDVYQTEQDLLKFLQSNFSTVDEFELLQAIYHVRDMNSGTLIGYPRKLLVNEIKKYLKKNKGGKPGWGSVSQVQWHNDHSESKCCICFEDYDITNSYSLSCQHEFHKKCITNWLKRQSACPVCRVHAVMDDEFPPLSSSK